MLRKLLLPFLIFSCISLQATTYVSEVAYLIHSLENAKNDIKKVNILMDIASKLADETRYDESRKYANEGIKLASELKSDKGLMSGHYELGRTEYLAAAYPASIDSYFKSLNLATKLKNKTYESMSLNGIGLVYYALEDFPKAIQYLNASIEKNTDSSGIADAYVYLAGIYFNLAKYDSSQVFYQKAEGIYKNLKSTANIIMCQQNMAAVYSRLGLKEKAVAIAEESLLLSIKTKDPEQIGYAFFTVGFIASENGMYQKAITNFSKSLSEFIKLNDLAYISNCHKGLSDSYYSLGDSKNALEHYITYIEIKDSTNNIEQAKEITRKEVLFQVEKKQFADSLLSFEKANSLKMLNDEKIMRQKMYTYFGVSGFALMLVLAVVLIRSNRNKQKTNELIAYQKQEVEHQKNIIEEKQKEIIDSITYAKRIQNSLLPTEKYIAANFKRLKNNIK